jgi:hypothetical protein
MGGRVVGGRHAVPAARQDHAVAGDYAAEGAAAIAAQAGLGFRDRLAHELFV